MVSKNEIVGMFEEAIESASSLDKDLWDVAFYSRYMSNAFFANNDIYTRKAFRYYTIMSLMDIGYIKNIELFSLPSLEGFSYLTEIIDKYFDIFVSEKQFTYIHKGLLNLYDGTELTSISSIFCDMFEELMFGGLESNDISDLTEDIQFVMRLKIRTMTLMLNGISNAYSLSKFYDFVLETIKKYGGKYNSFPEFVIKSNDEPSMILNFDDKEDQLINDIHSVCKPITNSVFLPEPIIKVVETNDDWITRIEIEEVPILVVNRIMFVKYRFTYEIFYDFAKSIAIIDSLNDLDYIKASIYHGYENINELEDAIDFCTEPVPFMFCKHMFGIDLYNKTMNKDKLNMFMDNAMKQNHCSEVFDSLKKTLNAYSWKDNLRHINNYKFNKKNSYKELYKLGEWLNQK